MAGTRPDPSTFVDREAGVDRRRPLRCAMLPHGAFTRMRPRSSKENENMLCSIIADGKLHIFQVTATGDLVHGSHAAGTGAFPFAGITQSS